MARKTAAVANSPAPEAPASPTSTGRGAKTITVMCKLPMGLRLRLWKHVERPFPTPSGGFHTEKAAEQIQVNDISEIVINGYSAPAGQYPAHRQPIVGGYAMTPNVDREFFEEWMRQNADHDAVKNKLIFGSTGRDAAEDQANEQAKVRDGMGPLEVGDYRNPKPMPGGHIKPVEKADV